MDTRGSDGQTRPIRTLLRGDRQALSCAGSSVFKKASLSHPCPWGVWYGFMKHVYYSKDRVEWGITDCLLSSQGKPASCNGEGATGGPASQPCSAPSVSFSLCFPSIASGRWASCCESGPFFSTSVLCSVDFFHFSKLASTQWVSNSVRGWLFSTQQALYHLGLGYSVWDLSSWQ